MRERYQLHHEFILYAGQHQAAQEPRAVHRSVQQIRAGAAFQELKLLMIGDDISKTAALRRAVHQISAAQHVRFLGYLPDETLAVMYRLAGVFVFPSLYEGFGLPPLEAMASGTPVVTSNLSSLPEVTGDAAQLVDPYDPQSIADGIYRVLTDVDLRRTLRTKGLARAHQFSWGASVRRVREIYGQVADAAETTSARAAAPTGSQAGIPPS
ncbi:MAG: glycosyltransferase family 1 protein [Vicinamibacterales bacterium]